MTDSRTSRKQKDPRERDQYDQVNVRPYTRQDGIEVRQHSRSRPVASGKLKFRMTDQDIRVKGKISLYDSDGRKIDTQRINARERLTPEESRQIKQLQGGVI